MLVEHWEGFSIIDLFFYIGADDLAKLIIFSY